MLGADAAQEADDDVQSEDDRGAKSLAQGRLYRDPCYCWAVTRRALCALLVGACQPPGDGGGFGSYVPGPTSAVGSSSEGSAGSSTTHAGEGSSTSSSDSSADGGSIGPRLDLGQEPDLEPPQPAGCKGKIDFLFVISSGSFVENIQEQLVDAFPKFIDTIQSKFEDFDYHIMVVDGTGGWWGHTTCNEKCPLTPEPTCTNYACEYLDLVGPCETTYGAGTVFNAGTGTLNKPCGVVGGRRYLTREQPQLKETFECIARVGVNGGDVLGYQLVQAISPELVGPGGCNEGFLRDDALLFITLATASIDDSPGTPSEWAQAVINAKHDDPGAIVAFGVLPYKSAMDCWDSDRVCQLVRQFPYSHWIDYDEPDYGPGFDVATDLVKAACDAFIPR